MAHGSNRAPGEGELTRGGGNAAEEAPMARAALVWLLLFTALTGAAAAAEADWRLDPERSVLAVLTHKAGIGARLAHDHLILAPLGALALEFDPERPEATRATLTTRADALEIDAPAARLRWGRRLAELGALAGEGLKAVPEGDRKKVREAMLSPGQLDGAGHPEIRAELVALERRGGGEGERVALGWTARVRLTVRGRTIEKELATRWQIEAGELTVEALGEARFSELGIEPYSTLLGAIRNDDLFHLFVALAARPATAGTD